MKLEQSFEIKAPLPTVWAALIDVERVAPCLPGAEVTGTGDDGSYQGTFQVKLGPTTAAYRGTLKMVELDEKAHVATMSANAQEKRGQGSAKATMVSTMTETPGGTQVKVDTDFTLTGKLARFGRGGMIQDVSNRLLREFAACLQSTLEGESASAADTTGTPPSGDGGAAGVAPPAAAPTDGDAAPVTAPASAGLPAVVQPAGSPITVGGGSPATMPGGVEEELRAIRLELAALRRDIGALKGPAGRPAQGQPKPINGIGLMFGVIGDRLKRLLGRSG